MRNYQLILITILSMVLLTCTLFEPDEDTTPPELFLLSPLSNETVSEIVTIAALVSDEEGVAGTELYLNQVATGIIDSIPPYAYYWDTSPHADGSMYSIFIRGWDINGNYANSDTVTVTVDNSEVHPAPVENVSVSYQTIGYAVSWSPTTHSKFNYYDLLRSPRADMDSASSIFSSTEITRGSFFDDSANPLQSYFYQVNIVDSSGFEALGEPTQSPDPVVFSPSFLTATPSDNSIRLRWNDKSNFEESFILERDGGSGYEILATIAPNATVYLDSVLVFDVEYRYRIRLQYESVISGFVNVASAHSPLRFRPTELFATTTASSIHLSWDDNCIFETGYLLERDAGLGQGFEIIADLEANSTNHVDLDLTYDLYYRYRISAYTDSIQSNYDEYAYVPSPLKFSPTNLVAEGTATTIELTWRDVCLFETGFEVERSTDNSGYILLATVGSNLLTFTDNTVAEDEYYYYRVRAITADIQSNYSTTAGIFSPIQFMPINMSLTSVDTTIVVRWTDNCIFEDGFVLERDAGGDGFEFVTETGENVTSYVDTDMEYGLVYRYRVAALDDDIQSGYLSSVYITSPLQFGPTSVSISTVGNGIQLSWIDNCIFEDAFILERESGAGYELITELGRNTTSYLDEDLEYDLDYRYRVAARSNSAVSTYSYSYSVRSPLHFAPTDIAATSNDTSITVHWQDDCIFEEGFIVERNQGTGFTVVGTVGSNTTSYTDSDLVEGEYYTYRVAAFADGQNSDYSWQTVAILSPIHFAPYGLDAFSISNHIVLQWFDNCSFETGFRVERDAGAGFETLVILAENFTSYTDQDLVYGVEYRYRVQAFTVNTESEYSNLVTVNSPLAFAPTGLSLFVTSTTIDLSWQDNCIFETGFIIERDAGAGFIEIGQVLSNVNFYSDADLLEDRTYRYRVAAVTADLQSAYTSIGTELSPIQFAPINLSATAQDGSISLSWIDNCVFEEGFTIERSDGSGFVEIADLGANYTFYTDSDLAYNTLYSYRIAAYTATQQSNYTDIATLLSIVQLAPSDLTANAVATEVRLSWTDNSVIEEGFRIERSSGSGFLEIAQLAADVTDYIDYGPVYGVEYSYRVQAFVGTEDSEYTNQASASIGWLTAEWDVVSAGTYTIGAPGATFEHVVAADYEVMRYEVTNAQYATFLAEALIAGQITADNDGFYAAGGANELYYNLALTNHRILWDGSQVTISPGFELHPVSGVSWYGADAFASYYGWSLPTDNEWEVAARADTESDYPWGDDVPTCDLANYSGCNTGLIPVGQTTGVSPFGAYDMTGNTWEWTSSFFDGGADSYSFRGGSWSYFTDNLKVWFRTEGVPTANYATIGFRCVR